MPEEEKDIETTADVPPPPPAAQSKKKTIILIVVLVIVGLALAAGISLFVVTKVMGDVSNGGNSEEEDSGRRFHDAGIFIKLGDPKEGIIVNVGGPRSGKFLKATIIAEFNPGKKSVINDETNSLYPDAEVKVNDVTTQFLRATALEDFDATKQEEFKKQLKDALNAALGGGSVYDVYITSFLLQ